jgi:hypothetical protein
MRRLIAAVPHLEFFSGKNFVKPNAFNPLRAAPVLKSRV